MNLNKLISQPDALRNEQWEEELLGLLPSLDCRILTDTPQTGPDGWPYLFVEIGEGVEGEPVTEVFQWLLNQGVGLALNPQKPTPDYVLTYGQLWLYQTTGKFFADHEPVMEGGGLFEIAEGEVIVAGPPTEEYFPTYARKIVKEFLSQQGVEDPRVLVMSEQGDAFDLCFSAESLGNPPQEEHMGILEALSWFFPASYSLVLIGEEGLPEFTSLA
ncbi:MAG: hypothetical protein H6624_13040 [Bdellovibrionaceae bacterium]|nr:hypothetical protein [Bdellovibrionales bacterium]MCB9085268.1 hypothetical protein [Pseudobdellovibrionaceae bacterium]